MSGAVVPDDWDGSTFKCYRVEWPQSEQYEAILLGATSRPSFTDYWDPATGDVDEAAEAVTDAFNLTLPDFYSEACEPEPPPMLFKAFGGVLSTSQTISAMTWTVVEFATLQYAWNSPEFTPATFRHGPISAPLMDVWHYDILLRLATFTEVHIRVMRNGSALLAHETFLNARTAILSFDFEFPVAGDYAQVEIYSLVANTVNNNTALTRWTGHFLPVEAS